MTSTPTTNLRIEKPAAKDYSYAWDVPMNRNFDNIDAAIAGVTSLTLTGGTYALADASDYTTTESRAAILDISGTLVSNQVIVVPNRSKPYIVQNRTSGAFTLGFATAAPVNTVFVQQGNNQPIYCDGANNVYPAGASVPRAAGATITVPSGTSGGILGYTAASTVASSALLAANGVVIGGGAGATPTAISAGTTGQVLLGNTGAAPSWLTAATSGQLLYGVTGSSPAWTGSADLFWDQTNKYLSIGSGIKWGRAIAVSSTDLNNLKTAGFYDGTNLTNSPDGTPNWFYVQVQVHSAFIASSNEYVTQTAWSLTGTNDCYFRMEIGGTWGAWRKIVHSGSTAIKLDNFVSGFLKTDGSGNVSTASISTAPDVIVEEQQTSGTDSTGAYGSNTFATLTLNTLKRNVGSIASLASSQVTFGTGTYYMEMGAIASPGVSGGKASKIKLRNITDSTDAIIGTGAGILLSSDADKWHVGADVVTIAASKTFSIQGWSTTSSSTKAGHATSSGVTEVYTYLKAWKL